MAVVATVTAHETRANAYNGLRGTVPVPADYDGTPLVLRDPDGNLLPTQNIVGIRGAGGVTHTMELRARYFTADGGVKTFNVEDGQGRISSPDGFHDHITVFLISNAPGTEALSLSNPTATVPFTSRLLQAGINVGTAGDVSRTLLRSGEMVSSLGTKLWGWRAWITTWAGDPDVWIVEMEVLNGNVGTPGSPLLTNCLDHLFFDQIRVVCTNPASPSTVYKLLHLHPTPYTNSTNLMALDGGGKLHPLLQGGGKHYRFAIHTDATFARASVLLNEFGAFVCDFSKDLWSWNNPETAWYGPHAKMVPELDLSSFNTHYASYSSIAAGLAAGTSISFSDSFGNSTPLGPYHVRGPTDGQFSGGSGIAAFKGYDFINTGSISKLKVHMAILSMDVDRAASTAADQFTGIFICDSTQTPLRVSDWDVSNICFINTPGFLDKNHTFPFMRYWSVNAWRETHAGVNNLKPGYFAQLGSFNLYDDGHIIRPLAACIPLIWLRNDPLAKSYVAHLAVWSRMHTLEYGPDAGQPQDGGGSLWWSYEGSAQNVQDFPGKGAQKASQLSGRIGGWAILIQMIDWLATDDDTKRLDYDAEWLPILRAHHELAQLSAGSRNWHAMDNPGDHPVLDLLHQYNSNGHVGSPDACAAQTIEVGIHAGAILGVHHVTGDAAWLEMLADAMDGLWAYHRKTGTGTYHFVVPVRRLSDINEDPWATQGAAPDCFTEPPSGGNPLGVDYDNDQVGTLIAAALTHDPSHASARAAIFAMTGTSTIEDARDALEAMFPSKMEESWGPVLAILQDLTADGTINIAPMPMTISLVHPAPTIDSGNINVRPNPMTISLVAPEPSLESSINVRPAPMRIPLLIPLPSLNAPDGVTPSPMTIALRMPPTFPGSLDAVAIRATLVARQRLEATLTFGAGL